MSDIKQQICQIEDSIADWAENISHTIFQTPELSDEEFVSSQYLVSEMKKMGFKVTYPYMGLPTAFRCEYGDGDGKKVAFLAEYDALPGYGENHDEPAHACGHNWISASTAAAAVSLAKTMEKTKKLHGKIVLIGTPGEEVSGRKVDMAAAGAFDDIDAVFQMHLGKENCVDTVALAMTDFVFEFYGKAAHAAKEPENGINALDACNLTLAGISALRQQLSPDVKIHTIITNGGQRANIIPEYTSLALYVRADDKDKLERVIERLLNIGKGAQLMTGAKFQYSRAKNTYYNIKRDENLNIIVKNNLAKLGITELSQGDIFHAESTDIGNVSYVCPTSYTLIGTSHISDAGLHESEFIKVASSKEADKLIHIAAKAMAMSGADVLNACKNSKGII